MSDRTMTDSVSRFLFEDLDIRGALVQLTGAWIAMQRGRRYAPPVAALLGEMAAVSALLASNLKTPGRLCLQLQGDGAVPLLLVDCDERLQLRGMARAEPDVAGAPLRQLLGEGRLQLSLQGEDAAQPYLSTVPLEGGTVAEIFQHYLLQSEQQPARLWLFADGERAAGLFLQALPGASERDADGWNRVQLLAGTLHPDELLLPAAALLARLFPEETIRLFAPRAVAHHCPRDEDKVRGMLIALGRVEVQSILDEQGEIVIRDDICNQEYRYGAGVIGELFAPAGKTLH
ncbi:MAG TPA: Hsp33 family molecular chaperone HslO [Rhodocyclaceae bacterium]|nr:Hsp33 family molecular chaperone HslO [Rhodocyclaceae bacterium]